MRTGILIIWGLLTSLSLTGQLPTDSSSLNNLLNSVPELAKVLHNRNYRVQIHYTPVTEGEVHSTIVLGEQQFFYPASTVKLPVALLTLQKMNELGISAGDRIAIIDSIQCGGQNYIQKCALEKPTFEKLLSEMIVVSDNDAYNVLYQFLNPEYIANELENKGYNSARIYRSFAACKNIELHTNPVMIYDSIGKLKMILPSKNWEIEKNDLFCDGYDRAKRIGSKNEKKGKIETGPFDFNFGLEIGAEDLMQMMIRLFYPEDFMIEDQWEISSAQRDAMMNWMNMVPSQLDSPKYKNTSRYPDDLYKYTFSPALKEDEDIVVYSKLGLSYGFTTEVAYITRKEGAHAFFLVISLYTNENKTVNDGVYEYESIARPFISEVTKVLIDLL